MRKKKIFKKDEKCEESIEETPLTILLQVVFPFLIAGFGMVAAGVLLDTVQVNY